MAGTDTHGNGTLARWQGGVDANLNEHARRLESFDATLRVFTNAIEGMRVDIERMRAELAVIRTKVAFWGAIGGLVGAGIVSAIVAIASAHA